MLLKEKNRFNHLIKQKRFLPLDSSVFYRKPASVFNSKGVKNQKNRLNKEENHYPSKNGRLKESILKTLDKHLNINKYSFFENHQRFRYKRIHTYFRSIISDQKKRAAFAKDELKKTILKALLSANQRSDVFQRQRLFNNAGQQAAFRASGDSSSQCAKLGSVLFLEKSINPLFTEKTKSFSRIRNRCLLSGQSSIVGKYRLGRICFRHYVSCGLIPGLTKNRK